MEYKELKTKVLEALNISVEATFTDEELCQMLNKKRQTHHSDKIIDPQLKEDFDKKFIEYDALYKELTKFKMLEVQNKEIALVNIEQDYYETKQENIELEEEIIKLKSENEKSEKKIQQLEDSIIIVSRESILKERESLINTLKPKKKEYFGTLGIIAALTIGINLLTKFGDISSILNDSFNINANYVLLSIFSIISLIFTYNLIRESLINHVSLNFCTTTSIKKFAQNRYSNFSDSDVFDYFENELKKRKGVFNWTSNKLFRIYSETTLEVLKEIFILELLNKKVIRLAEAYCLERKYMIIRQYVESNKDGTIILKEI